MSDKSIGSVAPFQYKYDLTIQEKEKMAQEWDRFFNLIYPKDPYYNGYVIFAKSGTYEKDGEFHKFIKRAFYTRPGQILSALHFDFTKRIDYYLTCNTHKSFDTQAKTMFSYNSIVADLDLHHRVEDPALVLRSVNRGLDLVKKAVELYELPCPNVIVFTGRGLQLWWSIKQVSHNCHRAYKRVASHLHHILKTVFSLHQLNPDRDTPISVLRMLPDVVDMEIDEAAGKHFAGYFRMPGTYNTKANTYGDMRILHTDRLDLFEYIKEISLSQGQMTNAANADIRTGTSAGQNAYTKQNTSTEQNVFIEKNTSVGKNTSAGKNTSVGKNASAGKNTSAGKNASTKKKGKGKHVWSGKNFKGDYSYCIKNRIDGLKQYVICGQKSGKLSAEGYRNNVILLTYCTLIHSYTEEETMEEVRRMNQLFTKPMQEQEIANTLCSAMHRCYLFTNSRFFEILNIDEDEIALYFSGLHKNGEKRTCKPHDNTTKVYRTRIRGSLDVQKEILRLAGEGLSKKEISKALNVSEHGVAKFLKEKNILTEQEKLRVKVEKMLLKGMDPKTIKKKTGVDNAFLCRAKKRIEEKIRQKEAIKQEKQLRQKQKQERTAQKQKEQNEQKEQICLQFKNGKKIWTIARNMHKSKKYIVSILVKENLLPESELLPFQEHDTIWNVIKEGVQNSLSKSEIEQNVLAVPRERYCLTPKLFQKMYRKALDMRSEEIKRIWEKQGKLAYCVA